MANSETEQDAEQTPQKHKYFEDQFDDEEVLFVFRHHPVVMRMGLVLGLLGPLVGVLPSLKLLTISSFVIGLAGGTVLGGLIMLPSWISWYFSVYIVTDQRFMQITQKRLFHRAVADLALAQIQSVNYEVSGVQETLLGFGTIKMQTYVGDLTIRDVHHPAQIQKKIVSILRSEGISSASSPAATIGSQAQARASAKSDEETED